MADRARPLGRAGRLGVGAGALVLAATLGPLAAVLAQAGAFSALGPADWAALRFTVLQALISACLSVALAVPLARALARRRFFGRGALITLLGAPFILPVIVAVLGLIAVFGRAGIVNMALAAVGLPGVSIYGMHGVILAHVFLNLPLATRLILQGWLAIPSERFRLAASLGMGPADVQRRLEWPMLRDVGPGVLMAIFLICLTSFAVALTLGGGPRATTLELAIYQAFRFDFDLGRAAALGVAQFALCALAAGVALGLSAPAGLGAGLDRVPMRWDSGGALLRVQDGMLLVLSALFLMAPLAMVIARGVPMIWDLPTPVWWAALRSVVLAVAVSVLTLGLALVLATAIIRLGPRTLGRGLETAGMLTLAASPLVMGTGLFLMLQPWVAPPRLALPVTGLVNALMSLPFVLRIILPALRDSERDFGRLADSLGLTGLARLRWLTLPRLRRPLGFAAGLTAALSIGDLGVIALFADTDAATLPMQVLRLMGAYRTDQAAGAAVVLMALALALFWICDQRGRAGAEL